MNRTEIRLSGMSRSGNHAIIDWIMRQADGRVCFLNCAEGKTNPFESCRPLSDGRPWRASWENFDLDAEAGGRLSPKDLLLHSYEDSYNAHAFSRVFEDRHDAWVGPSGRRLDVVILRDPFNLFASRRAMGADLPRATAARMWKQHARTALKALNTRPRKGSRRHPLPILYNRWASERAYRAEIAARLGLSFTDAGIETVAACNGGSSFDGLAYDGRAGAMRVTERWRAYADDTEYLSLFDAEMVDLSRQLFGPPPHLPRLPETAPAQPAAAAPTCAEPAAALKPER
ncbi:hypothetical protein C882_2732 [Caenispirillum salinarum AK4]|uniref:Sulfotransferase family protein n=2 Tax=Caenispirillum TaxID=414051 RepID=K9HQX6_9PROT|nr:hypothetical protein C882_2732 [Caenispirillum salinarum AK4]